MKYLKFGVVLMTVLAITFAGTAALAKRNKAKNIIVMISDGWGYNQIDATSMYQYGKTGDQVYEKFPCKTSMSTYMYGDSYDPIAAWDDFDYVTFDATDSAAAATTMSTGIKTYSGAIGVDLVANPLKHAMEFAEEQGKSTGVVTSVEFSHATPAGFVAHNVSRNNYAEIANEMIYDSAVDVIMGAGAPDFDNSGDPCVIGDNSGAGECNPKYVGGLDTWIDLTDDNMVTGSDANDDGFDDVWNVIRSRAEFQAMASGDTPARVIGVPYVYQTLQYNRGGDSYADPYVVPLTETVPSLEEMTKAALNVLDNDEDGFVLMIEAGAVDWAGHGNRSGRLIEEQIDFNKSVEAVCAWIKANSNWGETLLIVTGDHETGYLNGPESDPEWNPIVNNGAGNLPDMEWHSGSHTNQLIPFFAKGPTASMFKASIEGDDPVRGPYIDNTAIGEVIIDILSN
ncbi:MAG: alkaline phosphatase [Desulfobacterales bacterium]|jgi:alkaline phosphatase